jgi:hypothetical protein
VEGDGRRRGLGGDVEGEGDGEGRAGTDGCGGEGNTVLAWREGCERARGLEGLEEGVREGIWEGGGEVGRGKGNWEVVARQAEVVRAQLTSSEAEKGLVVDGWAVKEAGSKKRSQ